MEKEKLFQELQKELSSKEESLGKEIITCKAEKEEMKLHHKIGERRQSAQCLLNRNGYFLLQVQKKGLMTEADKGKPAEFPIMI